MSKLCVSPLFLLGLTLRFCLIFSLAPLAISAWYGPFLEHSISPLTLDPWSSWINQGGNVAAFPYGYAMWLVFLPLTLTTKLVGVPIRYGYELTLLTVDFAVLMSLEKLVPGRQRLLLIAYWLSPIVLLASYALGFNDLIPIFLLLLSILLIRQSAFKRAGVACAAAISAKLSMVIALPLIAIYLYNNKPIRHFYGAFLVGLITSLTFLELPFVLSEGGVHMLLGNPEMGKVYLLAIELAGSGFIYVTPLIYMLMLYMAWRVRRINFDLFLTIIGLVFLLIVLLTPAAPGWFLWLVPFLALHQARSDRVATLLIALYSFLYVFCTLLDMSLHTVTGDSFDLTGVVGIWGQSDTHMISVLRTAMMAIGFILGIRMWREAISKNDYFRISRKPFVIGIAGDSGAGKDTFSDAIEALFGMHSVVKLSGDDYHLWDRQKPIWQLLTHLNPMANDLEGFCNDLISLSDGKSIQSRHYDHDSGKLSKPHKIQSNDFIIASGLHTLYMPMLRDCYNLKVYLDIDEGLRKHFKLKRDVNRRGHTVERVLKSFEDREPDSERFIRPQAAHADLVFSVQPIHPRLLQSLNEKDPIRFKLVVISRHGYNELSLNRVLVGICGLHVDKVVSPEGTEVHMTIEGETYSEDMSLAAKSLCPRALEFLDASPKWKDGVVGLMQLIILSHINQALTKRVVQ